MSDEQQTFKLDLDIKEFVESAGHAKKAISEIAETESIAGLAEAVLAVAGPLAIVGVAALALKVTFDQVFEGEQIKRTNALFNSLAESAGLTGETLKEDLVKAAHGMATENDVIQAANKSMVLLGDNAARMPEIMNLARNATRAFGGDLTEKFQQISYAIASGSQRMLRQNGIMIDVQKAEKDYARELGITSDLLTDAGKKQAIMNAALEFGEKKFKDVASAQKDALTSAAQFKVTIREIGEAFTVAFEKIAGPTVRSVMSALADAAKSVKDSIMSTLGEGSEKAAADINILNRQIQSTKNLMDDMRRQPGFIPGSANFKNLEASLDSLQAKMRQEQSLEDEIARKKASQHVQHMAESHDEQADANAKFIDQDKLHKEELKLIEEIKKAKLAAAQEDIGDASTMEELKEARVSRDEALEEQHEAKISELRRRASETGGRLHSLYLQQIEVENNKFESEKSKNEAAEYAEEQRMNDNRLRSAKTMYEGFSAASAKSAHDAMGGMTAMGKLGQTTFTVMQKRGGEMFQNLGKAAVDGSMSAADVMKGFFLNALGDIAQSQGEMYLAMGLAPGGQGYLAAGAGLLALSGVLHALAGSSGGSSSSYSGGGGSLGGGDVGGGPSSSTSSATPAAAPPTPQKAVTIQVMGHYFETEQTKTALMDMVRSATDATDFKYVQIGQT